MIQFILPIRSLRANLLDLLTKRLRDQLLDLGGRRWVGGAPARRALARPQQALEAASFGSPRAATAAVRRRNNNNEMK